jgi:VWFA-related protein
MLRQRPRFAALLVASLLCLPITIQPQQAPQEPAALRVTTRLVVVNVIVQDSKGAPLEGLTRDDFALRDEGDPQGISLFSMETMRRLVTAEPLPPNTFSNRAANSQGQGQSVTAILLDFLNTRWQDRVYAKAQVVKFLQQLQPDDRVALYSLSSGLRVLHNFTTDSESLVRALNRQKNADATHAEASIPEQADTGDADMDAILNELFQQMADFYVQDRARRTADAMVAIANHLASFPGRKNLVWVSSSFPIHMGMDEMVPNSTRNRQTFSRDIERAVRALNNANLSVYPVDARGLVVGMPDISRRPPAGSRGRLSSLIDNRALNLSHDTMNLLADRTGGRAFYNSNDIKGAIRRAIDDAQVTYTLGYYPSHNKWDGAFRRIRVSVNRKDAKLRYRTGYFTLLPPQPAGSDLQERQLELVREAQNPLPSTSVGFTVHVKPLRSAGTLAVRLTVELPVSQVTLAEENGRHNGTLDWLFGQFHSDGEKLRTVMQTTPLSFSLADLQEASRGGVQISKLIELAPSAERLVVIVRDVPSGNLGSVFIPLKPLLELEPAPAPNPR